MKKIAIFLFYITLIIVTGCAKRPQGTQPIRIGTSIWPGYAYVFIAQEKGFFKDNGVNVELVFTKGFHEVTELYKSGKVDGILEVFTDSILHNSEGIPTKVVCVVDYSDGGDVIVANPEINSLLDLKEKPVGIGGVNSFSHLFVLSILNKAGVKEEDIRFEIVYDQEVPKALEEGRIFAGHTFEPARSEALKRDYKIIAKAGDMPGTITDVLSFNARVTEKRPDEIRAIVRALFQAQDFIRKNRTEAVAIMAKKVGMTPEEMDSGLKGFIQPDLKENKLIMKRSDDPKSLFNIGKMVADFYLERGQLSSIPDFDKIIEPRFVEELGE